ncbi:unnamed protein product, partial [Onchocerca ochengi]
FAPEIVPISNGRKMSRNIAED